MLQVKTYLDKSSINGLGLFAAEDIKAGDLVWRYVPWFDKSFDKSEHASIQKIIAPFRDFLEKYAYYDKQMEMFILSCDDDRFTNHSDSPNTRPNSFGDMLAVKDIKRGEEITANYYEIDKYADDKLHLSLF